VHDATGRFRYMELNSSLENFRRRASICYGEFVSAREEFRVFPDCIIAPRRCLHSKLQKVIPTELVNAYPRIRISTFVALIALWYLSIMCSVDSDVRLCNRWVPPPSCSLFRKTRIWTCIQHELVFNAKF
jgi:hypothetical protein